MKLITALFLLTFSFNVSANSLDDAVRDYEFAKSKIEEQTKILEHYENYSQHYGRAGHDLPSHTKANIRMYEQQLRDAKLKIDSISRLAGQ